MTPKTVPAAIRLAFCFSLVACCPVGNSRADAHKASSVGKAIFVSNHATILVGKAALPLFHPCSRSGPNSLSGYWTPSVSDIQRLESDAPKFLKTQKLLASTLMINDYRQYAGFIQNGRQLIYVNGFPENGMPARSEKTFRMDYTRWRYEAVVICDGGPKHYGMEYDPQTRQFQHLEFNGFI